MAIMTAALTLLNKSNELIAKDRDKLVKLNNAHLTMKQLTNALLQLWRGQQESAQNNIQSELQNKVFLLDELVENSVSACQQHFFRRNIFFAINMQGNTKLYGQFELAEILINNLLRNACQYSVNGKVTVDLNKHCLIVENDILTIDNTEKVTQPADKADITYGYGVGLFLVEKICQQQKWQLTVTSTAVLFTVQITFHNVQDKAILG